jgi:hypothetical protein
MGGGKSLLSMPDAHWLSNGGTSMPDAHWFSNGETSISPTHKAKEKMCKIALLA